MSCDRKRDGYIYIVCIIEVFRGSKLDMTELQTSQQIYTEDLSMLNKKRVGHSCFFRK